MVGDVGPKRKVGEIKASLPRDDVRYELPAPRSGAEMWKIVQHEVFPVGKLANKWRRILTGCEATGTAYVD